MQVLTTRKLASTVCLVTDFRSEPSDTPEGSGVARRTWDAYIRGFDKVAGPVVDPFSAGLARKWAGEMIGFWVLWHAYGGFEGLERFGMHKSTIWRKVKKFRLVFGQHPDTFRFEGIDIDVEKLWKSTVAATTDESE